MITKTLADKTIASIYTGKDEACRCGCKGTYARPGDGMFTSRLKRLEKMLADPTAKVEWDGGYVNVSYGNDRAITAYFD